MIRKLENAGLGYHINAEETKDTLGGIPMRRLVYRVRELPESMFPLVWDFGNLSDDAEAKYIAQMIRHHDDNVNPPDLAHEQLLQRVLSECQRFMRGKEDECSFVSLR